MSSANFLGTNGTTFFRLIKPLMSKDIGCRNPEDYGIFHGDAERRWEFNFDGCSLKSDG